MTRLWFLLYKRNPHMNYQRRRIFTIMIALSFVTVILIISSYSSLSAMSEQYTTTNTILKPKDNLIYDRRIYSLPKHYNAKQTIVSSYDDTSDTFYSNTLTFAAEEETTACLQDLNNDVSDKIIKSTTSSSSSAFDTDYLPADLEAQKVCDSTVVPATSLIPDDSFMKSSWVIYTNRCSITQTVAEAYISLPSHENIMAPAAVYLDESSVIWVMENDNLPTKYHPTFFKEKSNVISRKSFATQVLKSLQHLYKYGNIAPVSVTTDSFWLHSRRVLKLSPAVEMKSATQRRKKQNRKDLGSILQEMQEDSIIDLNESQFMKDLLTTEVDTLLRASPFLKK